MLQAPDTESPAHTSASPAVTGAAFPQRLQALRAPSAVITK